MTVILALLYGAALLPNAAFFGIAAYLFLAPSYDKLSGSSFIEFFQKTDPYMKVRAPMLFLAQVALTLPLLFVTVGLPFWLTLLALLLAVAGAGLAIQGNLPLNRQMRQWMPHLPPPGWERVRARWLRCHSLRGMAESAGFVVLLTAALLDGRPAVVKARIEDDSPAPRRWEATVYLPLSDTNGRPFGESEWHEALGELIAPFGGATLGQATEGYWRDEHGRLCRERVRPVIISFAPERLAELRAAVHEVGQRLGQEAVYVRFEEPRVALVYMKAG